MSRFDRRLGTGKFEKKFSTVKTNNSVSPRPGTASCKLRPNNTKMLSNITTDNNVIQNQASVLIDEVSQKNERIMGKLQVSRNPTERILLNHELRLNTMELNVDCLNNLDCDEKNSYQMQIDTQKKQIHSLEKKLQEFEDKLNSMVVVPETKDIKEEVTLDIKDTVKKTVQKTQEKEDDSSPTFE